MLCLFYNRPGDLSGPVWDAIQEAYAEHAPALDRRASLDRQSRREQEFESAPGFTPWILRAYDWSAVYDAESYAGLVQTHSDHLLLPSSQRERLIDAIRSAITEIGGGQLEYRYHSVLMSTRTS